MNISCIILAGGESIRMNKDKKFLIFHGKSFLERSIDLCKIFSDDVIVSLGNSNQKAEVLSKGIQGIRIVLDHLSHKGPLIGLYNGLKQCSHEYVLVIPCDVPFLDKFILKSMIDHRQGYDAIVLRSGKLIEPLLAIYKVKSMLEICEESINSRKWDVKGAVLKLKLIKYIDVEIKSFFNVNTREDFKRILDNGSKY